MTTETLNVDGMTCNHCKMNVEKNLGTLAGISSVTVDLDAKTVTVETDGSTDLAKIKQTINEIGYTVVD